MTRFQRTPKRIISTTTKIVSELPLWKSANFVADTPFTELPALISERAVGDDVGALVEQTSQELNSKFLPTMEYIPMPKEKYGNRPLAVLSPQSRVVMEAICTSMETVLPVKSRDSSFGKFELFGTGDTDSYLVDIDIASCYEYIDHERLFDELVLRGGNAERIDLLRQFQESLFGRGLGLPQGVEASHWLSDVYLEIVERNIGRHGLGIYRYADDFRIIVNSTKEAYDSIQLAVEECRQVYLAVSERKIKIRPAAEVLNELKQQQSLFQQYVDNAYEDLTDFIDAGSDYGTSGHVELPPEEEDVDFSAISTILRDWGNEEFQEVANQWSAAGAIALSRAKNMDERIDNQLLDQLVSSNPVRLRRVMDYVRSRIDYRDENAENWSLINSLSRHEHSSPWQKVWLLSTSGLVPAVQNDDFDDVMDYAVSQLEDPHEVVRAEAAWLLAKNSKIKYNKFYEIYLDSSSVTNIGLRAVAGKMAGYSSPHAFKYFKGQNKVASAAFEWGRNN